MEPACRLTFTKPFVDASCETVSIFSQLLRTILRRRKLLVGLALLRFGVLSDLARHVASREHLGILGDRFCTLRYLRVGLQLVSGDCSQDV